MSDTTSRLPAPPRQSPYGWPLPDRREEFTKLLTGKNPETLRIEDFKGAMLVCEIIRVPINLPKYRIANGRTASGQQEWVAHKGLDADFFDGGDPELETVQSSQHEILKGMIKEEGLLSKFKDAPQRQVDPILLDENGFVLNGNRRLCCWRELHTENNAAYGHFGHVDVVVLPHCNEQELDRLEARLQIDREIRSDYSWDAEANMLLQKQRLHGFTTPDMAKLYGKKKSEVDELLGMREIAADYLKSRGKENTWSLVRGDEFAFRQLFKVINSTQGAGDRELVKQASFSLIDDPEKAGDRLYNVIPKVKEHLKAIKTDLSAAFPIQQPETDVDAEAAFGGPVLAPTSGVAPARSELALVAEIKKDDASIAKAREVIAETIRSQAEQELEKGKADYLFKTLKKANGLVQAASAHGLRPECSVDGVEQQIGALREALDRIVNWVAEKRG